MENCIFCQIVEGKIPASIVYRDNLCVAFMDIKPINPGHVLVIPIKHSTYIEEMDKETGERMFTVAKQIAGGLKKTTIKHEGYDLFLANGESAGQEVFHVHLHIIPRYKGDGFGFKFGPNYNNPPKRDELEKTAKEIREHLI